MDDKQHSTLGTISWQGATATAAMPPAASVREADLNRLQEDLNRANHKLSVATGHEIRASAAAVEATHAKKAAESEVARLRMEYEQKVQLFHAQRAEAFGIKEAPYISPSASHEVRSALANGGFVPPGGQVLVGEATAEALAPLKPALHGSLFASVRAPVMGDALASARNFGDLSDAEMDEAVMQEPQPGETHTVYKLASGELVVGGPLGE